MRLRLPNHIQDMIQDRGLDIDHIKQAIKNPDDCEETFQDRVRARKEIDDHKTIEVIYFKEGFRDRKNDYIIVTAYYLEQD